MNYLSISLIIFLTITLTLYFLLTRKIIRRLLDSNSRLSQLADLRKDDLNSLTDKYRQLANINKALREITEVKNLKQNETDNRKKRSFIKSR